MSQDLTLQTSGITFGYREYGLKNGLPVLMLHGFPDAPDAWDALIELLQPEKNNLRLLPVSQRGYGHTVVEQDNLLSGEVAALASDALAFANALGLDRFVILGHDWGARTAFAVSILAPGKVLGILALSSPYAMYGGRDLPPAQVQAYWYQWYFQTAQGAKALQGNARELCRRIWEVWSPGWKFSKRDFERTAKHWENAQFAAVVLHSYRHRWGNALGRPAYAASQAVLDAKPRAKIAVPTIFGYGTDDGCVLPEASEEQKSLFTGHYERVAIKGSGHFPHRENPKAVAKLFTQLLKKVRTR